MKILILSLIGVYLFTLYDNRIDRKQTLGDWFQDFIKLITPSTDKAKPDLINLAIYAKNKGVI